MCAVSMVHDFARSLPPQSWTPSTFDLFQQLIRRLDDIDAKLGLPDCVDPAKSAFMADIERRLAALETKSEGET